MKKKNILKLLMLLIIPSAIVFYSCEKEEVDQTSENTVNTENVAETRVDGEGSIRIKFSVSFYPFRATPDRPRIILFVLVPLVLVFVMLRLGMVQFLREY